MSSFYGGRQGNSFSIAAVFPSKQAMIQEFKKGADSAVHFDEYVAIIDDTAHPEENGNIYRRGYKYTDNSTGGAELIGNLFSVENMSNNSELIDLRTGLNNVQYLSAGEAVRTQIDQASQYRAEVNAQYATYHSHVYEYTKEGTFYATQYDTSSGTIIRRWGDLPDRTADFIIRNTRYGNNWVLQTAIQANSPGAVYQRVVPRTNATGNHPWYFIGQPTASQINNAVSGWLDAHPEATTTVQDGSVTKSKFAAALASEIDGKADSTKLAFVTPEMFDAVGDGVTDDYQAIQGCIDYAFEHNARVEFSCKTYAVSDTVKLYGNCIYNGNNCTIKQTSDVPTMGTYKYFDSSKESKHVTINDFWLEGNVNNANNDGLILCGWYERVNHVNVQNVGGHGIVITSYLENGNEISSNTHTLVEGMILNSKFRSTNPDKYPFYVHCSDSFMITDWRIENCIFASADCPCFMWFDRVAGWFLTDVQCYGNARNSGIYAHFASGTHMENITLDGIMGTGIYFGAQLGSCHATNVHIVVSAGVTGEIYAIRQTGGSSNPAALAIANIDVNVKSDTTPSALYLHRGSSYIFDVVNPVFVKDHAEISYQYFYYLGDNSVFRLNGFKILSNTPVNESTENFSRHYSTVTYSRESTTLTLTVTPSTTIDKAGLLLVAGEVNGASKGNSVYSVGLFHRGTVMPCQLISEQSGFEFTDVGVSYDSSTNTYTIVATTPNTDNCRYSMNVIF